MTYIKLCPLTIILTVLLVPAAQAGLHFDPSMISGDPKAVADLSRFESGGDQLAGEYMVDIYLNGIFKASRQVRFIARPADERQEEIHDGTGLMACMSMNDLTKMGVNIAAFPGLIAIKDEPCISPGKYIPQAYTTFNFQQQRLDVSIPQAALKTQAHGWIPPQQWDEGINAALLTYRFSGSENRGSYGNSRSNYLNLISGLNLGAWRLRDNSTWSDYESVYDTHHHWQHLNTYLQRAIIPWRSELTAGDSNTNGDVFDPLTFRGLQLASDDSMYPDTMRGFAPVIKGNANSNAQVSVRQNGNVIYRIFVAPGAFIIKDLYPVSTGGDLDVTVTEADGSSRTFIVPYSSLPVLQRQGHLRYGITAGRYRKINDRYNSPAFAQGTLLWGLPHNITAYGGAQLADSYRALALGAGLNMGLWGAISADVTQADSLLADGTHHEGQSVRFLYGRSLISTGTTFQLAGYRYSTQGFHTLDETALKNMSGWITDSDEVDVAGRPVKRDWVNHYNLYNNKRERIQASISQRIGGLGSLYLTGSHQTYWQNTTRMDSLQVGFSSVLAHVNYSLSYGYSRVSDQPRSDQSLYLSISVPLDNGLSQGDMSNGQHSIQATFSATRDSDGHLGQQTSLSGTALQGNNLDWNVTQGYGQENGGSGDVSLDYQGRYGSSSLGYGYSREYKQVRYGAAGSAVLHSGGLTLGQPLGNTNVLIAAPGSADVPVENNIGVRTDWRGYTIVPYASTYRENRVALDISGLDDHTDIDNPVTEVIPTRGALVRADFRTHIGIRSLMTLSHNGIPLPFGSMVSTADGSASLVGDGGQVWLPGLALQGVLKAQWGKAPDQRCTVHYRLPEKALHVSLLRIRETCR